MPKYQGTLVLYYNKDLFDTYEVPYPDDSWNHDDYLAAMKQLTRDTNDDGRTDIWGSMIDIDWDRLQVHINAWGGHVVDPADPHALRDRRRREALAALEWVRARMWDDKVMATFTDVNNVGTAAAFSQASSPWSRTAPGRSRASSRTPSFRIGVAPIPGRTGGAGHAQHHRRLRHLLAHASSRGRRGSWSSSW